MLRRMNSDVLFSVFKATKFEVLILNLFSLELLYYFCGTTQKSE